MTNKRNLSKELKVPGIGDSIHRPRRIDTQKIKHMVHNSIDSSDSERKIKVMKSKRKIFVIAAAAALVLGVTAFASSGIVKTWYGHSWGIPEYTSLPTAEQCVDKVGYTPVLIDSFENGYAFRSGTVVSNDLRDEGGNSIEKFKSLSFSFEKDGASVELSQQKYNTERDPSGDVIAAVNGVELYYAAYINKLVPPNYKMTAEDEKAEESGELVFSWGSDQVENNKVQSVSFEKDGIDYQLMQRDGKLTADELAQMAKEMIEK